MVAIGYLASEVVRAHTQAWTQVLQAELGGGPVFPVIRAQYYFEPDQTVYAVPWLTAEAAGGIGLRF